MSRTTTPEGSVLKSALSILNLYGVFAFRNNSGVLPNPAGRPVRFGTVGASDILGVLDPHGRFLAIECKAPGRESSLTTAQWDFLDTVQRYGGVALIISDPARLAEILAELRDDPDRTYGLPPRPAEKRKGMAKR